jgi:hypothetical protein
MVRATGITRAALSSGLSWAKVLHRSESLSPTRGRRSIQSGGADRESDDRDRTCAEMFSTLSVMVTIANAMGNEDAQQIVTAMTVTASSHAFREQRLEFLKPARWP